MKKNCNGCKALFIDGCDGECRLGYKMGKRCIFSFPDEYRPLERCPKPITYKQLIFAPKKRGEK